MFIISMSFSLLSYILTLLPSYSFISLLTLRRKWYKFKKMGSYFSLKAIFHFYPNVFILLLFIPFSFYPFPLSILRKLFLCDRAIREGEFIMIENFCQPVSLQYCLFLPFISSPFFPSSLRNLFLYDREMGRQEAVFRIEQIFISTLVSISQLLCSFSFASPHVLFNLTYFSLT